MKELLDTSRMGTCARHGWLIGIGFWILSTVHFSFWRACMCVCVCTQQSIKISKGLPETAPAGRGKLRGKIGVPISNNYAQLSKCFATLVSLAWHFDYRGLSHQYFNPAHPNEDHDQCLILYANLLQLTWVLLKHLWTVVTIISMFFRPCPRAAEVINSR